MIHGRALTWFKVIGVCFGLSGANTAAAEATTPAADPGKSAASKPADESKKAEAASRFDRALKLFEAGDNAGALAEFKRTYEVYPDPMVLYNMGLVYAAMNRPVDAVDALGPLVTGNVLSPTHLERAKQTLADQQARIGRLLVKTTPAEVRIEVDGVEVANAPLSKPIRVSEGKHIVGAVAEGYAPARKELFIAGNADATLELTLVRTQDKQLANLTVRTRLNATEVYVDGTLVGKTPLSTSVSVPAGRHVVVLRRPGYVTVRRELDVGPGATAEIPLELAVDPASLDTQGATLVLDSSESPLEVTIDGERKGLYREPLRLPRGPHHVSITAAGFLPFERDVNLVGAQSNLLSVTLEPTPETRKHYQSNARFHRTWGWIGILGGAAIAGGGVVVAVVGSSRKSDAQADLDAINTKYDNSQAPCDYKSGFAAEDSLPKGQQGSYLCNKTISDARSDIDAAKTLRTVGYVGIGVGSAVAITGLVLLLTGNDPNKYDGSTAQARTRSSLARPPFSDLTITPGPGEFGTGLRVSF